MAVTGYVGQIHIGSNDYLVGSTLFAILDTTANPAIGSITTTTTTTTDDTILFTVPLVGFSLADGITVHIQFKQSNIVTDKILKLKVGDTLAKQIKNPNGALSWAADSVISFTYDKNYWIMNSSAIDGSSIQNLSLGNITNEGKLSTASSLVVTDSNKKITTGVAFTSAVSSQTQSTTFLRSDGTWAAPSYTTDTHHQAKLIVGGSTSATDNAQRTVAQNEIYLNLIENSNVRSHHKIVGSGGTTVSTDTNGNITITGKTGTVTSVQVQATSPIVSSTSTEATTTLNTTISLADAYGDTKNPYGAKTANYILAGPSSGNAAAPSFRALVEADIPSEIARLASPTFTGTPLITTTPTSGDNSHKIADTAFVVAEISSKLAANDAMLFKGTIGTGGTITAVPDGTSGKTYQAGYTYRVITAGTYAGYVCEIGDLLIAVSDSTSGQTEVNNNHWTVAQTNIDGALYKGTTYTSGQVLIASSSGAVNTTGITITSETTGFTISGGTTSKTLTVNKDITLGNAAAKNYTDSSSASAISTGTSLVTERDVYYGLPQINHTHNYTSSNDFYAPTSGGTAGQYLKAGGENTAPTWETFSASTVGLGNVSNDANLNSTTGTKGDIIYWSDANVPAHLAATTNGYVLTLSSGVPTWAENAAKDEKVKQSPLAQNSTDANKEYAVLFKNTHSAWTEETAGVKFSSTEDYRITINPSTGTLTAKNLVGALRAADVKTALGYSSSSTAVKFLHESGAWKTLSISTTDNNSSGMVVTSVSHNGGSFPSLGTSGKAATFSVSAGVLTITAGSDATLSGGSFPTVSMSKADLSVSYT